MNKIGIITTSRLPFERGKCLATFSGISYRGLTKLKNKKVIATINRKKISGRVMGVARRRLKLKFKRKTELNWLGSPVRIVN